MVIPGLCQGYTQSSPSFPAVRWEKAPFRVADSRTNRDIYSGLTVVESGLFSDTVTLINVDTREHIVICTISRTWDKHLLRNLRKLMPAATLCSCPLGLDPASRVHQAVYVSQISFPSYSAPLRYTWLLILVGTQRAACLHRCA